MLRELDIRDVLIIDHLHLEFGRGLNVLTGETGAGKSILLDCLGFVLGWRGRADLVRQGAAQGEVIAIFDLPQDHPVKSVLDEAGLPQEDELILRRVNTADGRKTAWVNDRRVSGEVLRALSDHLLELHGQHDDRGLLDPKGHRDILDQFADFAPLLDEVRQAWSDMSKADKALETARIELEKVREEEEFLRHSVDELSLLSPEIGEDEALDTQRRLMQGAEKIRDDIAKASQALGTDGAEGAMGDALRWLIGVADRAEGKLDTPITALERALSEMADAARGIEDCLSDLSFNPHELEEVEERLFAIRGLARKHQVQPDELPPLLDALSLRLEKLDAGAGQIAALEKAAQAARAHYNDRASDLRAARQEAARRLDAQVAAELAPLKMERAEFVTQILEGTAGPKGIDQVDFRVATNPGAPAGPLAKIASGGELSRFLLALKVCLSKGADARTMIFDEIDRGVGGATADAVGRRLADLGQEGQVLVVTHSPQVAAKGQSHFRVQKRIIDDVTLSEVVPLSHDERVDEIARMISGDTITTEARAAALALIKS